MSHSNPSSPTLLSKGTVVEIYGCTFDKQGHYVKEYEIVSLNADSISLKHLRTRRDSGVTEEPGMVEVHGRDMIDHLLIPSEERWKKHYYDSLAIAGGLIRGGSLSGWMEAAKDMPVPNSP